jgi:hypothetical protein
LNIRSEIRYLGAETLALQIALVSVLSGLAKSDPKLAGIIREAFDNAANIAEEAAIRLGKAASPEHTVRALEIIEEMRVTALGSQGKPKHGV